MATELVEGRTLREILNDEKTLPAERALDVAIQIAAAPIEGGGIVLAQLPWSTP